MTQRRRRIFNLLKPYLPPPTAWDKVYEWLVGKARIVMVVIELLVVATFFVKVFVDIQAGAYNLQIERIGRQLDIREGSIEPSFLRIQQKSAGYSSVWNLSASYAGIVTEVLTYIGTVDPKLDVRVASDQLRITGATSLSRLQTIENQLKSSANLKDVRISVSTTTNEETAPQGDYVLSATIIKGATRTQL